MRYPALSFLHIYPGTIKTGLMDSLPFYLRLPARALTPFMTSAEDCAEVMVYALTCDTYQRGSWLLTEKGEPCQRDPAVHNADNAKKVWDHTVRVVEAAAAKSVEVAKF